MAPLPLSLIATQLRLFLQAIRLDAHRLATHRTDVTPSAPGVGATALRYLPLAGILTGLLFSILYVLFAQMVPHSVAVVLAIAITAWTGGGSHELGLAGLADALAAHRDARSRTAPLRATGTLALVLLIALKVEVLSSLDPSWISIAVIAAAALSRGLAVAAVASLPPRPRPDGAAADAMPHPSSADGLVAATLGLLPAAVAAWWLDHPDAFASALAPAVLTVGWLRWQSRRRLGHAGLHAIHGLQQATEIAFLVGLLVWWTLGAPTPDLVIE